MLAERYNAKIYNFFGKLILEENNIAQIEKIFNLKNVDNGIYILKLYDEGNAL